MKIPLTKPRCRFTTAYAGWRYSPVFQGGKLFTSSDAKDGALFAGLDPLSGRPRVVGAAPTGPSACWSLPQADARGYLGLLLYRGVEGGIDFCLFSEGGELVSQIPTKFEYARVDGPESSAGPIGLEVRPLANGEWLLGSTGDFVPDQLLCLSGQGQERWRGEGLVVHGDSRVALISQRGRLVGVDPGTGVEKWSHRPPENFSVLARESMAAVLCVDDNVVRLIALDLHSGGALFAKSTPAIRPHLAPGDMRLSGTTVTVQNYHNGLTTVFDLSGNALGSARVAGRLLESDGKTLLFSDGDLRLWAAPAHRPGEIFWTFDLAELPGFAPTPNAHEATAQDGVICFAPLGLDKAWVLGG